jgi:hypothetical protein
MVLEDHDVHLKTMPFPAISNFIVQAQKWLPVAFWAFPISSYREIIAIHFILYGLSCGIDSCRSICYFVHIHVLKCDAVKWNPSLDPVVCHLFWRFDIMIRIWDNLLFLSNNQVGYIYTFSSCDISFL